MEQWDPVQCWREQGHQVWTPVPSLEHMPMYRETSGGCGGCYSELTSNALVDHFLQETSNRFIPEPVRVGSHGRRWHEVV